MKKLSDAEQERTRGSAKSCGGINIAASNNSTSAS